MFNFSLVFMGLMILFLCRKAFEFEKVNRFERITLPIFSLVMFMLSMKWTFSTLIGMIILTVISILIGIFQLSKVEIKVSGSKDKYNRPIILIKKILPF